MTKEALVLYQIESGHRKGFLLLGKETNYFLEDKKNPQYLLQRKSFPAQTAHTNISDRVNLTYQLLQANFNPLPAGALFAEVGKKSSLQNDPGNLVFSTKLRKSRGNNVYGAVKGNIEKCESASQCIKREIEEEIGELPAGLYPTVGKSHKDFRYYLKNVSEPEAQQIEAAIGQRLVQNIGEMEDLQFRDMTTFTGTLNDPTKDAIELFEKENKIIYKQPVMPGGGKRKTRRRRKNRK